jgi:aspartyl protease family protein
MSAPGPWGQPKPPGRKASRLGFVLWAALMALVVAVILALDRNFPIGETPFGDPYLVQTLGFLALVSSSLLFVRQINLKRTARNVLIWMAVGGALIIGFSFQNELRELGLRLRSNLVPGYPVQTGTHEMILSADEGGGFHVIGAINGTPIRFLIDTGASDIVLSPSDAIRLGIDLRDLKFDRPYESANGIGHGASLDVSDLSVGAIRLSNVRVSVNGAPMSSSLLGMAFLTRLKSYNFSGNKLILKW